MTGRQGAHAYRADAPIRRGSLAGSGGTRNPVPAYEERTLSAWVSSVNNVLWLPPGGYSYGTVAAWHDSSGYENHPVASGDARPELVASWLDGNPGVRFDGVDDLLRCYSFTGLGAGSKPCVIAVCAADSSQPQSSGTLLYAHDLDSPNIDQLMIIEYRVANGGLRTMSRLGSGPTTSSAQAALQGDDTPHWLMSVAANASNRAETWVDGVLAVTASSGAANGLTRTITHASIGGTDQDEGNPIVRWLKITIGELIMFDGVPTAGELTALRNNYLAPTWPSLSMP